jgi:nucleotide-binding universal stress UspA family protein
MKILVAVDDASSTKEALRTIVTQIRPEDAEVRLLHVLEPISRTAPPQMSPKYTPELEGSAQEAKVMLAKAAKSFTAAGYKTDTLLEKGDIRESIIDSAAHWNADLVVLGSHNHSGMHRFLLGSVAESVVRHAPCSVEIVRGATAN